MITEKLCIRSKYSRSHATVTCPVSAASSCVARKRTISNRTHQEGHRGHCPVWKKCMQRSSSLSCSFCMRSSSHFTLGQTHQFQNALKRYGLKTGLGSFLRYMRRRVQISMVNSVCRLMPLPNAGRVLNKVHSSWCCWWLERLQKRPLL